MVTNPSKAQKKDTNIGDSLFIHRKTHYYGHLVNFPPPPKKKKKREQEIKFQFSVVGSPIHPGQLILKFLQGGEP